MDYIVIQSFARVSLPFCLIIMHLYTELIFYDGSFELNLLPSALRRRANQSNSKIMSIAKSSREGEASTVSVFFSNYAVPAV